MLKFLFLIFMILPLSPATAETPFNDELSKSIVMIKSSLSKGCASGFFISENTIVTSYHVVHKLCRFKKCHNLFIKPATKIGGYPFEKLNPDSITLISASRAMDIALLRLTFSGDTPSVKPLPGGFADSKILVQGTVLHNLSFPGCKQATLSSGIVSTTNQLIIGTSIQGNRGSSGSPVFTSDGKLAGIVKEATSPVDALLSKFSGADFNLNAANADWLKLLLQKNYDELFQREVAALNTYYKDSLRNSTGFDRFASGMSFLSMMSGLKQDLPELKVSEKESRLIVSSGMKPVETLKVLNDTESDRIATLEQLVLSANLVEHGTATFSDGSRHWAVMISDSMRSPEQKKQLSGIISHAALEGQTGLSFFAETLPVIIALFVFFIGLPWIFTIGYCFGSCNGSFIYRIFITAVVALFIWPVSFLIYLVLNRKSPG